MPNYSYSDDPGSAIKNKLGARTHDELDRLEGACVAAREAELMDSRPIPGNFDAGHLKAIHQHLFQDVFEWAGHTRDEKVTLSDGSVATEPLLRKIDGKLFMVAPMIPNALDALADKLCAAAYLKGLARDEFADRAAGVMMDLNAVHPFRDGNGRTQRVFMRFLAEQAGHGLDFSVVSRARMIQASMAANDHDDNSLMRRMFAEISNPARVAALLPAIEFLEAQSFAWNDHYLSTAEPDQAVEVTFAGPAGQHFMARTGPGILIGQAPIFQRHGPSGARSLYSAHQIPHDVRIIFYIFYDVPG